MTTIVDVTVEHLVNGAIKYAEEQGVSLIEALKHIASSTEEVMAKTFNIPSMFTCDSEDPEEYIRAYTKYLYELGEVPPKEDTEQPEESTLGRTFRLVAKHDSYKRLKFDFSINCQLKTVSSLSCGTFFLRRYQNGKSTTGVVSSQHADVTHVILYYDDIPPREAVLECSVKVYVSDHIWVRMY